MDGDAKMDVEAALDAWGKSLCPEIAIDSLRERSEVAQKWKAMFRSITLRETLLYRAHDLLTQSLKLHQQTHTLGARILLRSAFETVAVLIYLNLMTDKVLNGELSFHEFGSKCVMLLAGSKNDSTGIDNVNIMTCLKHADKKYEGILKIFATLSETAHPSFEGMMRGYVKIDHDEMVASFSNRWHERYGEDHLQIMERCMEMLGYEYDLEWPKLYEQLERWLEANDEMLEATKVEI